MGMGSIQSLTMVSSRVAIVANVAVPESMTLCGNRRMNGATASGH